MFVDSNYCGDQDDRRRVMGYTVNENGVAITWNSKSQHNLSLLTTEIVLEAMREVKFLTNLRKF